MVGFYGGGKRETVVVEQVGERNGETLMDLLLGYFRNTMSLITTRLLHNEGPWATTLGLLNLELLLNLPQMPIFYTYGPANLEAFKPVKTFKLITA